MKLLLTISFFTLFATCWTQDNIDTEIKAQNVFELSIVDIYPENYPNVSVVFQAKNEEGKPLWLLEKSEMNITENGDECEIIKLENITTNKPLNIALVFDHSGSMVDNPEQMPEGIVSMQDLYFNFGMLPDGYVMPIEYAKKGVYSFINSDHNPEDSVLFVGFSSEVDEIPPLTNNLEKLKPYIDKAEPSGGTAFYDAIFESVEALKNKNSQPVVVAITDGLDNKSNHAYDSVIEYAKRHNTPVFIIGLGNVDKYSLSEISARTDGFFYHTNDPNQLEAIYRNIKEQLRSIYQVDYRSMTDDYFSKERTIKFSFLNDTLTFSNPTAKYELPEEAQKYLAEKEKERLEKIEAERLEAEKEEAFKQRLLLGGIGGGILLLGIGSFVVLRRKKATVKIEKIFPNPFNEKVTVRYTVSETIKNPELKIVDLRGNTVALYSLSSENNEVEIDSSSFRRGVLVFQISGNGKRSSTVKGVRR